LQSTDYPATAISNQPFVDESFSLRTVNRIPCVNSTPEVLCRLPEGIPNTAMSTLLEIKSEEEWKEHSASLPPTTLQIIYFKAEWAQPVSVLHMFF
jgi:hypothetical protein